MVKRDRVQRGGDTDVGRDRLVIGIPAVAIGRNVHHEVDVEVLFVFQHGIGIFGYLLVHQFSRLVVDRRSRAVMAAGYALAAADAFVVVDLRIQIFIVCNRFLRAFTDAHAAGNAFFFFDLRLGGRVHLHFALARTAAHSDVLQCAAETGLFVALEMVQADDHIAVSNSGTDLGALDQLKF